MYVICLKDSWSEYVRHAKPISCVCPTKCSTCKHIWALVDALDFVLGIHQTVRCRWNVSRKIQGPTIPGGNNNNRTLDYQSYSPLAPNVLNLKIETAKSCKTLYREIVAKVQVVSYLSGLPRCATDKTSAAGIHLNTLTPIDYIRWTFSKNDPFLTSGFKCIYICIWPFVFKSVSELWSI